MPIEPFIYAGTCPLSRKSNKHCPGMKACALLAIGMLCVSCAGKSSSERLREVEFTAQENQSNIAEVTHRVSALENRLDGLSGEVRQMNTRTYEVRNKAGRKTGMTAHPVIPPAPPAAVPPAAASAGVPVSPGSTAAQQAVSAMEPATVQQKPKAPLPSMNDVPPPMTLPGQPQATRGNSSPTLSLPPHGASAPVPQASQQGTLQGTATGATASAAPQGAPSAVAPVPAATPSVARPATPTAAVSAPQRRQPPSRTQAAASVSATAPAAQASQTAQTGPAAQSSLALPPETGAATVTLGAPQATATPVVQTAQTAQTAQGAPSAKLPSAAKGEEAAYKAALSLVMSGRAGEGRQKFNDFLQSYPAGRYAANAHYWIGESYYGQGNYPEALMSFKQVSTQFPRHHKTADALLKAGMTYQKLGDKENAQLQYKALQADFPNSEAASRVRRSGR